MKIDFMNVFYGDPIGTLEYVKNYINFKCNSSGLLIESFLKSFCAELRTSNFSYYNKQLIFNFLMYNEESILNHYWDYPNQSNTTYDEWREGQTERTQECIDLLKRAENRFNMKQNNNEDFDDEKSFTGISMCYKYLPERNIYCLNKSPEDLKNASKYYYSFICVPHLRLLRN